MLLRLGGEIGEVVAVTGKPCLKLRVRLAAEPDVLDERGRRSGPAGNYAGRQISLVDRRPLIGNAHPLPEDDDVLGAGQRCTGNDDRLGRRRVRTKAVPEPLAWPMIVVDQVYGLERMLACVVETDRSGLGEL